MLSEARIRDSSFILLLFLAVALLVVSGMCLQPPELDPRDWVGEPFQLSALGLVVTSVTGLMASSRRSRWLVAAAAFAASVSLAGMFAIGRWAGGDDGGGMAWLFFVLPGAALTTACGLGFFAHARHRPASGS
jgi:hypothetical protein